MESNHRRSNLEVMADILRLREAGKTEIMYSANMSYHQLQRYLHFLVERGFLQEVAKSNPGVKYYITENGQRLLEGIDALLQLLNDTGAAHDP